MPTLSSDRPVRELAGRQGLLIEGWFLVVDDIGETELEAGAVQGVVEARRAGSGGLRGLWRSAISGRVGRRV